MKLSRDRLARGESRAARRRENVGAPFSSRAGTFRIGLMSLTAVDVLLVFVVGLALWQGWRRGLLLGLLDRLSWAWSILFALRFYPSVARWIGPRVDFWD